MKYHCFFIVVLFGYISGVQPTCKDMATTCSQLSSYCDNYAFQATLKQLCAATCGFCVRGCNDRFASCKSWAGKGYCKLAKYPIFKADIYCRYSCGFCEKTDSDSVEDFPEPTKAPVTRKAPVTKKKAVVTKKSPVTTDVSTTTEALETNSTVVDDTTPNTEEPLVTEGNEETVTDKNEEHEEHHHFTIHFTQNNDLNPTTESAASEEVAKASSTSGSQKWSTKLSATRTASKSTKLSYPGSSSASAVHVNSSSSKATRGALATENTKAPLPSSKRSPSPAVSHATENPRTRRTGHPQSHGSSKTPAAKTRKYDLRTRRATTGKAAVKSSTTVHANAATKRPNKASQSPKSGSKATKTTLILDSSTSSATRRPSSRRTPSAKLSSESIIDTGSTPSNSPVSQKPSPSHGTRAPSRLGRASESPVSRKSKGSVSSIPFVTETRTNSAGTSTPNAAQESSVDPEQRESSNPRTPATRNESIQQKGSSLTPSISAGSSPSPAEHTASNTRLNEKTETLSPASVSRTDVSTNTGSKAPFLSRGTKSPSRLGRTSELPTSRRSKGYVAFSPSVVTETPRRTPIAAQGSSVAPEQRGSPNPPTPPTRNGSIQPKGLSLTPSISAGSSSSPVEHTASYTRLNGQTGTPRTLETPSPASVSGTRASPAPISAKSRSWADVAANTGSPTPLSSRRTRSPSRPGRISESPTSRRSKGSVSSSPSVVTETLRNYAGTATPIAAQGSSVDPEQRGSPNPRTPATRKGSIQPKGLSLTPSISAWSFEHTASNTRRNEQTGTPRTLETLSPASVSGTDVAANSGSPAALSSRRTRSPSRLGRVSESPASRRNEGSAVSASAKSASTVPALAESSSPGSDNSVPVSAKNLLSSRSVFVESTPSVSQTTKVNAAGNPKVTGKPNGAGTSDTETPQTETAGKKLFSVKPTGATNSAKVVSSSGTPDGTQAKSAKTLSAKSVTGSQNTRLATVESTKAFGTSKDVQGTGQTTLSPNADSTKQPESLRQETSEAPEADSSEIDDNASSLANVSASSSLPIDVTGTTETTDEDASGSGSGSAETTDPTHSDDSIETTANPSASSEKRNDIDDPFSQS